MFHIWYEKDAQKIVQNNLNGPCKIGILARSNYFLLAQQKEGLKPTE
jgi:hypothetical protein